MTKPILLGYGTVTVGGVAVGLTRGGSSYSLEREYRQIEADGDKGPVVGRIAIDKEVPKLTINGLELFTADQMKKMYPALTLTTGTTEDTITSSLTIAAGDHADVIWTGATLAGKSVKIQIDDAINMEGIDWNFEDKNEVVQTVVFTGCWTDGSDVSPWSIKYGK